MISLLPKYGFQIWVVRNGIQKRKKICKKWRAEEWSEWSVGFLSKTSELHLFEVRSRNWCRGIISISYQRMLLNSSPWMEDEYFGWISQTCMLQMLRNKYHPASISEQTYKFLCSIRKGKKEKRAQQSIHALCETDLDNFIDSGNLSMRAYLPLI